VRSLPSVPARFDARDHFLPSSVSAVRCEEFRRWRSTKTSLMAFLRRRESLDFPDGATQ